jgi:hypothetical protein
VKVLHGGRPSQPPRPRVMQGPAPRLNLKRSQGRPWAGRGVEESFIEAAPQFEFVAPCSILHRLAPLFGTTAAGPGWTAISQRRPTGREFSHENSGYVAANRPWNATTTLSAVRWTNEDQNNHTDHICCDHRRNRVSLFGLRDRDDENVSSSDSNRVSSSDSHRGVTYLPKNHRRHRAPWLACWHVVTSSGCVCSRDLAFCEFS